MQILHRFQLVLTLTLPLLILGQAHADAGEKTGTIPGIWQGKLKAGPIELRLVFHIDKKGEGFSAKLDSPDQGANGIPCDEVVFKEGKLRLQFKKLLARYEGKIAGQQIVGEWRQAGQSFPLTLERTGKAIVLSRPQEPKPPYPYREEEVRYRNEKAGVKFAGTLTLPKGSGPFPAALLISGSGPQDRNEALMGHKPFLVLADYLTRRGIAVLRVDDRGVGGSSGDTMSSTTADFAGDALAGVSYLKSRQEIDPARIGLIGHSEGGIVAPLAATQSKDIAFIVLLAGTGLTGEQVMFLQGALIIRSAGGTDKEVARNRRLQEGLFKIVKEEKDNVRAKEKIKALKKEWIAQFDEKEKKEMGDLEKILAPQTKLFLTPWFRFFLRHDPVPVLKRVQCPVLALVGEKDVQVAPKENLAAIARALKEGGNKDFTVKELPGLNHLFQTCKTGALSEYARLEETMSPAVLAEVADWIRQRMKAEEDLNTQMMRATVKVSHEKVAGTGFFLCRPDPHDPQRSQYLLVTAAHVLEKIPGDEALLNFRRKESEGVYKKLPLKVAIRKDGKPRWTRHPSEDVAVLAVVPPGDADLPKLSPDLLATDQHLKRYGIHPGETLACLGFPHRVEANGAGFPILRTGPVAGFPLIPAKTNKTFLLSTNTFEGDSGGSVYLAVPRRYLPGKDQPEEVRLIMGLVTGQHFLDEEMRMVYGTTKIRHRLGLAIVVQAQFIRETLARLP